MKLPRRQATGTIWECKIGAAVPVVQGADAPMRDAVRLAYIIVTGKEPRFIFSGWGGTLTVTEEACASGAKARRLDKKTRDYCRALRALIAK